MLKQFIISLIKPFYMVCFRFNWRLYNRHNETHAINRFHWHNVNVGRATYGPVEVLYDHGAARLYIGNYCSIAKGVKFLLGGGIITEKLVHSLSKLKSIMVMEILLATRKQIL